MPETDNELSTRFDAPSITEPSTELVEKPLVGRPFTAPPQVSKLRIFRSCSAPLTSVAGDDAMTQAEECKAAVDTTTTVPAVNGQEPVESKCQNDAQSPDGTTRLGQADEDYLVQTSFSDKTSNISTWHPHVYSQPPRKPTPHSIGDILGWTEAEIKPLVPPPAPMEPSTLSRLLNQKPNDGGGLFAGQTGQTGEYFSHNYIGRRSSISETSDDDSSFNCDQPLNLCVPKSRDTSPSVRSVPAKGGKVMTGEFLYDLSVFFLSASSSPSLISIRKVVPFCHSSFRSIHSSILQSLKRFFLSLMFSTSLSRE
jgi:hypothetical protein